VFIEHIEKAAGLPEPAKMEVWERGGNHV
jgi:hypothetical protein